MTDKQKIEAINAEIERQLDEICSVETGFVLKENKQKCDTLIGLQDFIDSLPEEPVILDLILCHKWYDMTLSGEKPEEYREETAHWCSRICKYGKVKRGGQKNVCNTDCNAQMPSCKASVPTDITHVRLHRGYTNTTTLKKG